MSINHTTFAQSSGYVANPCYFLDQRSLLGRASKTETSEAWSARLSQCMAQPESKVLGCWNTLVETVKASHLTVIGFTNEEASTLATWLYMAAGLTAAPAPAPAETKAAPKKAPAKRKARAKKAPKPNGSASIDDTPPIGA